MSGLAGNKTNADGNQTVRESTNGLPELSFGGSYRSEPLLRPEDIRQMPDDKALLLYKNAPPFLVDKINYLTDRNFRGLADPNPYYRKR